MAQALPERAGLLFLEDLLPEKQGQHRHAPQAYLEDVENDDRHGQSGQDERHRIDQVHTSASAARIMRKSSSSKGTSVEDRVAPIP